MRDNSLPWREAFPEHESARNIPLRGGRVKEDLSLAEVARRAGISEERLRRLEDGNDDVDEELARRLGRILDIDHRLFLTK